MIYVAIKKVICSLDLAASSLQGWQSKIIPKQDEQHLKKKYLQQFPISSAVF